MLGPKRNRPRSIPVLKNSFLENYFGKAHWITPGIWFGPIVAWGLYRSFRTPSVGLMLTPLLFIAGWLMLSLVEYLLHRFIFHMHPGNTQLSKLRAFLAHGYHHDFPDDQYRLVLPPLFIWPPTALVIAVYWLVFGPVYAPAIIAGSSVGYVAYDWIHYYTHHARPTSSLGKFLRKYHMIHHFKYPDACYGVSSPLWDIVFGTYKPVQQNETETAAHS